MGVPFSDLCRNAAVGALALVAGAASADPAPCLAQTGLARVGFFGAARVHPAEAFELFEPNDVFCTPPHQSSITLGGESGAATAEYLASTGLSYATGAIGFGSTATGLNRSDLHMQHILEFRVVPDDPSATDPMPIRIRIRHDFGRVAANVSGPAIGGPWSTSGIVATDGASFPQTHTIEAPPEVPLYLFAVIVQTSAARGGRNGIVGSGAAEVSSAVTFEVDTEAAAQIVFASEERLGLPPPRLGVVVAPEPGAVLTTGIALATLLAGRRRVSALRAARDCSRRPARKRPATAASRAPRGSGGRPAAGPSGMRNGRGNGSPL